jgi:tetratricopeptide (TPR) repeat protein
VLASAFALALVTALVLRCARRRPYLAVGWLWYLVTLVPVVGLVQIGGQAMADRYTYLPLTGIFVAVAWGVADLSTRWRALSVGFPLAACVALLLFSRVSRTQALYWKDDLSLLRHDVAIIRNHYEGYVRLASTLYLMKDLPGAEMNYREALRIRPKEASVRNNLGTVLFKQGRIPESIQQFRLAVEANPDYPLARQSLEIAERALRSPLSREQGK